jgi:hypothetical protein
MLDLLVSGPKSGEQWQRSVGGVDLGGWLVPFGLVLDWPQYSRGRYEGRTRKG